MSSPKNYNRLFDTQKLLVLNLVTLGLVRQTLVYALLEFVWETKFVKALWNLVSQANTPIFFARR